MTINEILDDINRVKRKGDILVSWEVEDGDHIHLIPKERLDFLKACREIEAFKK